MCVNSYINEHKFSLVTEAAVLADEHALTHEGRFGGQEAKAHHRLL